MFGQIPSLICCWSIQKTSHQFTPVLCPRNGRLDISKSPMMLVVNPEKANDSHSIYQSIISHCTKLHMLHGIFVAICCSKKISRHQAPAFGQRTGQCAYGHSIGSIGRQQLQRSLGVEGVDDRIPQGIQSEPPNTSGNSIFGDLKIYFIGMWCFNEGLEIGSPNRPAGLYWARIGIDARKSWGNFCMKISKKKVKQRKNLAHLAMVYWTSWESDSLIAFEGWWVESVRDGLQPIGPIG